MAPARGLGRARAAAQLIADYDPNVADAAFAADRRRWESTMSTLWVLLALWIGTMAGFLLFGVMAMAQDSERGERKAFAHMLRTPARVRGAATRGSRRV